jgi:glycosyltransferase involved in cell wall biosynthesis
VRVIARDLSRSELLRLISAADCYVSLHRAEGFGYTCAEAMAYGSPVIATGYSGNLQYMNGENSFLVDWREVEVSRPEGPFPRGSVWAEPDVDHAAQLMRQVARSPEHARRIGERAARDVRAVCSIEAVGAVVAEALRR